MRARVGLSVPIVIVLLVGVAAMAFGGGRTEASMIQQTSAANGYQLVQASSAVNSTNTKTVNVFCPSGKKVLGGGYALDGIVANINVIANQPALNATAWVVTAAENTATSNNWGVTGFAVCAYIS